jgi:3-oxoacyl-ACP reductase-like protein
VSSTTTPLQANPQLTLSGLIGPIVSDSIQKYAKVDMPTGLQESLLAEQVTDHY